MAGRAAACDCAILLIALVTSFAVAQGQTARLLNTDTPAYLEFSATRYTASAGESNVVVTIVRTGEYRIPASAEYILRESSSSLSRAGEVIARGTVFIAAGRSVVDVSMAIPLVRSNGDHEFTLVLTNPGHHTEILQNTATISVRSLGLESRPMPALQIELRPASVILSWRGDSANCVVEMSESLASGNWVEVSARPVAFGERWIVEQPRQHGSHCFYRLRER